MIKENPKVSTADMAKELKIGIATVKRKIKKMSNVSYVGSGYSGHWEINEQKVHYIIQAMKREKIAAAEETIHAARWYLKNNF